MIKSFKLENLDCANCAAKIESEILKIDGVISASVSFMAQKITIETNADIDMILQKVKAVINKVEPDCELVLA